MGIHKSTLANGNRYKKNILNSIAMNSDYIILDIEWDHQIIKDASGKKKKMLRGIDYDLDWVKLNNEYAKKGKIFSALWIPVFRNFIKLLISKHLKLYNQTIKILLTLKTKTMSI
ncbi:MAG: hypothetical protein HC854_08725 [Flavobacterium sp.]|nr:hypothetical protein [Flavobacterium sp.]